MEVQGHSVPSRTSRPRAGSPPRTDGQCSAALALPDTGGAGWPPAPGTSPSGPKAETSKRSALPSRPTLTSHVHPRGGDSPLTELQSVGPACAPLLRGPLTGLDGWQDTRTNAASSGQQQALPGAVLLSLHRESLRNHLLEGPEQTLSLIAHPLLPVSPVSALLVRTAPLALCFRGTRTSSANLLRTGWDSGGRQPSSRTLRGSLGHSHGGVRIGIDAPGGDEAHCSRARRLPNEPPKSRDDKANDLDALSLVEIQFILFFPLIIPPGLTFSSPCGERAHRSAK